VNIFIIAIIGIIAFLIIFFALFPPQNDGSLIPQVIIKPEHYDIEITGLKETYLVGEPYSFSYILSGFGDPCGGTMITFPINKTDSSGTGSIPSCVKTIQTDFVLDMKKIYGVTYGHIALQEAGNYTVKVTFEKGSNGSTVATKSFLVVDDISTGYDILSVFEIVKDDTTFDVEYDIKGGTVEDMVYSNNTNSLLITIDSTDKGNLTLSIPRNLLDAKMDYCPPHLDNPPDDRFFVLIDGEEVLYEEILTTSKIRTLQIQFLENTTKMEIIASCLI
jgi:hypothetical protein